MGKLDYKEAKVSVDNAKKDDARYLATLDVHETYGDKVESDIYHQRLRFWADVLPEERSERWDAVKVARVSASSMVIGYLAVGIWKEYEPHVVVNDRFQDGEAGARLLSEAGVALEVVEMQVPEAQVA